MIKNSTLLTYLLQNAGKYPSQDMVRSRWHIQVGKKYDSSFA